MAKFVYYDGLLDDFRKQLETLGEEIDGDLGYELLESGTKVIVENWKKSIVKHGHVRTGAMRDSIASKTKNGIANKVSFVYPQGKDKKGVNNAEKAFIANYGKTGQMGTRFVEEAEQNSTLECVEAMQKKLDDYLDMKGL